MTGHAPQHRQPAGVPTGGQFAATGHPESAVTLDTQDVQDPQAQHEETYHLWFHHEPCGRVANHEAHPWGERNERWCIGKQPTSTPPT